MSLVVDACVLRSASVSGKPVPSKCRGVLDEIKKSSIPVSVDDALLKEWRKHRSNYSYLWISSMFSRKLVDRVAVFSGKSTSVENAISYLPEPSKSIACKDAHLLKIAVDRDYIVISSESSCRKAFHVASSHCKEISRVVWIFPSEDLACDVISRKCNAPHNWLLSMP